MGCRRVGEIIVAILQSFSVFLEVNAENLRIIYSGASSLHKKVLLPVKGRRLLMTKKTRSQNSVELFNGYLNVKRKKAVIKSFPQVKSTAKLQYILVL